MARDQVAGFVAFILVIIIIKVDLTISCFCGYRCYSMGYLVKSSLPKCDDLLGHLRGFLSRMKNWSPDTFSFLEENSLHQGSWLHAITKLWYAYFYIMLSIKVPGGNSHLKGAGMVAWNFELNPQRRPIWAWPSLFFTPKRDHFKLWLHELSKQNELKIYNFFIFLRVQP